MLPFIFTGVHQKCSQADRIGFGSNMEFTRKNLGIFAELMEVQANGAELLSKPAMLAFQHEIVVVASILLDTFYAKNNDPAFIDICTAQK